MLCKRLSDGADLLCRSVATVEEAEAVIENRRPHLVILDFKLGGENGQKYVKWVMALTARKRIPVIVIVDEANNWQLDSAQDRELFSVLVSPFRMSDLCNLAKHAATEGERTSSSGSFSPVS